MPDISKLTELSEIFSISIDELLNNKRAAEFIDRIISDKSLQTIEKDELAELASILKPNQVDEMIAGLINLNASDITSVAPFLSQNFIDDFAQNSLNKDNNLCSITPLAPLISEQLINKFAIQFSDNGTDIKAILCILPFVGESILNEFAQKRFAETKDIYSIISLAPFLGQSFIDKRAEEMISETNDLSSIACIAPFISDILLNKLASEVLEKHGLNALSPIMPFIDSKIVEDYIRKHAK
jgi:hypothetical protein